MKRAKTDSLMNPKSVMAQAARDDVEFSPDDRIIAVMGITGSGKSTFISHLTDGQATAGEDLTSYTSDMELFSFEKDNQKIHLIDTPGFDDTYRTDSEVLKEIAFWLRQTYQKNIKLSGIVYLHPINNARVTGSMHKNIRLFEKLCGEETLQTVVLATTFWNSAEVGTFERRQEQLKSNPDFWGDMVSRGSTVFRHDNNAESAMQIVDFILGQGRNTVLQIQREMVDAGTSLDETSAGQMLGQDLDKKRHAIESRLREAERELEQAVRDNDGRAIHMATSDQDRLKAQIEAVIRDREQLKITNEKLMEEKEAEYQLQRDQQLAETRQKQQELELLTLTNQRYRKEIDEMSILLPDRSERGTREAVRESTRTLFRTAAATAAGSSAGKAVVGSVAAGAAGLAALSCTIM